MVGSIISSGLAVAGSIFGGISASQAAKKAKEQIESQRRKNQDWFDREYNEDPTQRASAQRILQMTEESIRKRNREAAGMQTVMGGTEESVAAAKEANNKALADAASQIVVADEARKEQMREQFQQKDNQYAQQLVGIEQQKAAQIGQAVGGVASASAGIAGAF
ncbi:MAG: hypothetical protein K2I18_08515 [Paramuribaculum sp.]|nr:hypothetical protein [Paramuribaculum sp.]